MNKNNKNKYPTLKVITLYPLLGGLVGGMPLLIFAVPAFFFYDFVGKNQILPFYFRSLGDWLCSCIINRYCLGLF